MEVTMKWKLGSMKKFWTVSNDGLKKIKLPLFKMPMIDAMYTRKELGTFRNNVHKNTV